MEKAASQIQYAITIALDSRVILYRKALIMKDRVI